MASGASRRGIQRERDLVNWLTEQDWWAMRAPASLGEVDVVAAKDGRLVFYEVKSTKAGPFHSFGPKDRADLRFWAGVAGAEAVLCWHPPYGERRFIPAGEWP